jgi:hypothetical protein
MTATTDTRARIALSDRIELLETKPGKWTPYLITESGSRSPIRGFNKKGTRQWRTYPTVDAARENLATIL